MRLPEGTTLEFKQDVSTPKNILKTIGAFANTVGGRRFIGVEYGLREIVEFREPLDEEEQLRNLIADSIAARRFPDVELVSTGDKALLSVCVYPSGRRPLFVKRKGPLRLKEAMENLGLNHRPTFMYGSLQPAMNFGLAEMTQPNSSKSPTQKYRLSPKEERFLTLNN